MRPPVGVIKAAVDDTPRARPSRPAAVSLAKRCDQLALVAGRKQKALEALARHRAGSRATRSAIPPISTSGLGISWGARAAVCERTRSQRMTTGGRLLAGVMRAPLCPRRRRARAPGARSLAGDALEHVGGHVEVGVHGIDVVELFEHRRSAASGSLAWPSSIGTRLDGPVGQLGALDLDAGLLQRVAHAREVARLGDDLERRPRRRRCPRRRPRRRPSGRLRSSARASIDDRALLLEQVGHRAGLAQAAAVLGERVPTSAPVRLRLSVSASTSTATPPGP